MQQEIGAMKDNDVWTLVNKPANQNVTQCKWVFQIKHDVSGQKKYKARLVAKGFTQKFGIDYNETFSPVIRHSSLRILLALTVNYDLKIDYIDVTTAFLNGVLWMKRFICSNQRGLYATKTKYVF